MAKLAKAIPIDPSIIDVGAKGTSEPSGVPGVNKTRALAEMPASTFAQPQAPANPLANLLPPPKPSGPEFSVITCSVNDAHFKQMESVYQHSLAGEDYEIIRIADAKGLAEGYTRGAAQARGSILIFSHDDAAPVRPFAAKLRRHLSRADIVAGAGTDRLDGPAWFTAGPPHVFGQVLNHVPGPSPSFLLSVYGIPSRLVGGIQAFDGFWFATTPRVVQQIGFDAEACPGFHMYDVDFSWRAYRHGLRSAVATDLSLMHASSGGYGDPKWKPAADAWWAKYGPEIPAHRTTTGFQMTALTGPDANVLLAQMDRFVEATT